MGASLSPAVKALTTEDVADKVGSISAAMKAYREGILANDINGEIICESEAGDLFEAANVTLNLHKNQIIKYFKTTYKLNIEDISPSSSISTISSASSQSSQQLNTDGLVSVLDAMRMSPSSTTFDNSQAGNGGDSFIAIHWGQLSMVDSNKSVLGKGSFGVVVKAVYSKSVLFQSEVAVKVMIAKSGPNFDKDYELLRESVMSEVKVLQEISSKLPLDSDHMIKVLGVADGDLPPSFHPEFGTKRALGIVMRLEAGGTLSSFLQLNRGLRIVDRLHIVLQLSRAVAELHEIGVIHGDIKPENILLSHHNPPYVRLGDFGQSTFSSNSKSAALDVSTLKCTFSKHGTPLYSAPELLVADVATGARARPSRRTDVYAMGLVIYEVLCSVHHAPFRDIFDEQQLVEQVGRQGRRPPISDLSPDVPTSVCRLIELCWDKDRALRPSALECYSRIDQCFNVLSSSSYDIFLSHPWTQKIVLRHVKRYLSSIGYKVWYDEEAMQWDLKRSMEDGILKSSVVLACISRSYEKSRNCMFELSEAIRFESKPIVVLAIDADPFSWAGNDTGYGDLRQLCDINGQGKMFVDVGTICADPGWNAPDDSSIPKDLIDGLHAKLADLVKYLRGSQINCFPSLSSSTSSLDALYELKRKADQDAWEKRKAEIATKARAKSHQPINNASDAHRYLSNFKDLQVLSDLGGEAVVVSQLVLIIGLQSGNRSFNEELGQLGVCTQLAGMLRSPLLSAAEGIVAKIFTMITFLCRFDGSTIATNMVDNVVKLGQCGICELVMILLNSQMHNFLIVLQACVAIKCLCTGNESNALRLMSNAGSTTMYRVLHHQIDNAPIMSQACWAIKNLLYFNSCLVGLDIPSYSEALVKVLDRYQDNADVIKEVCGSIRSLISNDVDTKYKVGSLGCCEILVGILFRFQALSDVVEQVCWTFWNLSGNSNYVQARISSSGGCEALVKVLTLHQNVDFVVENSCGAIINLAANNVDNKIKLSAAGCCEALVKVLTLHQSNAALTEKICMTTWVLCMDCTSNVSKLKTLNCANVLNIVQARYRDNLSVSKQINSALKYF